MKVVSKFEHASRLHHLSERRQVPFGGNVEDLWSRQQCSPRHIDVRGYLDPGQEGRYARVRHRSFNVKDVPRSEPFFEAAKNGRE